MIDSSTKHPENRIHLYDPVGLINDSYSTFRPSNYTVRPKRQTVSYDNFAETTNNNNNLGLRSYNSINDTNTTVGLRSFDSFEVDSFTLRSPTIDTTTAVVDDRIDGGLRFVIGDAVVEDDQSDASTPRLWRPSSVTNPKSLHPPLNHSMKSVHGNSTSLQLLNSSNHNYQTMSANARTQAIAKGRRELMEMVRDLPETFYELSLKDIVEQKAVEMEMKKEIEIPEDKKGIKEVGTKNHKDTKKVKKSSKKVKKSESKKKMVRSKSVDNGKFLLKTSVFPILGSRKSKKNLSAASFKVAPMPKGEPASNGAGKVGEKEWWRRKSCISSESDVSTGLSSQSTSSRSSSSSSRSNSSNGRRSNRFLPNCCLFNGRRIGGKK